MALYVPVAGNASAQGVWHVCPLGSLTSAPGGSDSNCTVSITGFGLKTSKSTNCAFDEQAASELAHAMIARTRYMTLTVYSARRNPPSTAAG